MTVALQTKQIPSRIDDLLQILFWEWDEFVLFFAVFGAGIVLGFSVIGLLAAMVVTRYFKRSKGNALRGRLAHLAFWYGFLSLNKTFKRGGERKYSK